MFNFCRLYGRRICCFPFVYDKCIWNEVLNNYFKRNGSELYSIATIGFGISNIVSPAIAKFVIIDTEDYIYLFYTCGVLAIISLIICQFFINEKPFLYTKNINQDNKKQFQLGKNLIKEKDEI